ncbi:hypothetical protein DSA95_16430 [Salmonella enterica subsp. enterica serovar Plymouth]|nr:hypothetical protein [Salmonella enterica subsp. enterica serovar Plymouth]
MVGLDAGVAKLATLSDGTVFDPVNSFQKNQKKRVRLRRQLSRQVKFSNTRQKQKRKIQCLHSRIASIRRDYLHKFTTTVNNNQAVAVIENLKVKNLSGSAAGTVSQPGGDVRAKSGLNRSIPDLGGMKCAASLSTGSSGGVGRYLLFRQRTQASVARAVVIQRKKIACHKVNSGARRVDIPRTPM